MGTPLWVWIAFTTVVLALLALDLGVFHRESKEVSTREALAWTAVWVSLSLVFNLVIYFWRGPDKALEFLTGYLIEESLSVDNIFVFLMLFSYFKVPAAYQHKVLFWGILGALVMRFAMIAAGTALIARFHWLLYLFGGFLLLTGIKMFFQEEDVHPEKNPVVRLARRLLPVTSDYRGDRFVVVEGGRRMATPLLLVLVTVELTDLLFATDSIPAIFAVTLDPFIVYTSNVCAILGLRSLFFALAGVMNRFHRLRTGLAAVLVFVGVKMLVAELYKIPIGVSLSVVAAILLLSVVASLLWPPPPEERAPSRTTPPGAS